MLGDKAKINILCSREFKLLIKKAAADKGMDKLQDAYLKILEFGLEEFKKMEVKNVG